jgi:hypothetical protein
MIATAHHGLEAQNLFTAVWRPGIIYNHSFSDRWSGSAGLDLEAIWLRGRGNGDEPDIAFRPDNLNLQLGLAYQLTADLNLSGGYQLSGRRLYRKNNDLEHRFLQQLSLSERWNKFRIQGRLRAEQRFFRSRDYRAVHRLRSRLSTNFPLQGEQLDPGEPYINLNAEWLFNLSNDQPLFFRETRTYGGIGWRLSNGQRLENGLELRTGLINTRRDRRYNLHWRMTWIL